MPQPCPGFRLGKRSFIRRTNSGADGAPPYEIVSSDDRSNSLNRGCSMICHAIVGTPPAFVIRSRSISSSAWSAFQRRCMTSFDPDNTAGHITAKHPVAWKNGTEIKVDFCTAGSGTGNASPRRRNERACAHIALKKFEITLRCVITAPLGLPVVPDV